MKKDETKPNVSTLTSRLNTLFVEREKASLALDRSKRDLETVTQSVSQNEQKLAEIEDEMKPLKKQLKELLNADV